MIWAFFASEILVAVAGIGGAIRHARQHPSWRPGDNELRPEPLADLSAGTVTHSLLATPPRLAIEAPKDLQEAQ